MTLRVVTFGEIMLRLKTPGFERFSQAQGFESSFGGGEANVAVSLASFGVPVQYLTCLPQNELGDAALASLRQMGVGVEHILRGGNRLGIYFLEAGAAQRPSRVLYDRAGSAFATLQPGMLDWETALRGAAWLHWTGISPAVSENAAAVCLEGLKAARRSGLTVSCDLNYRAKLWKWTSDPQGVMQELVNLCDVAVGNEEDAEKVFGIRTSGVDVNSGQVQPEAYRAVCDALACKLPNLKTIALTLRGSLSASHNTWSGVLWQGGKFHIAPTYDILPIVDRVGGGDAFAAGLIYGLLSWHDAPQRALTFAAAAACLKHSIPGDFNRVSVSEVEALASGNSSGRVVR